MASNGPRPRRTKKFRHLSTAERLARADQDLADAVFLLARERITFAKQLRRSNRHAAWLSSRLTAALEDVDELRRRLLEFA